MIVGAAVCPGAPLLIPGVAPALASTDRRFVQACRDAVGALAGVDRILLITAGPRAKDAVGLGTVVHPPGTVVSSRSLTYSAAPVGFDGRLHDGPITGRGSDARGVGRAGPPRADPGVGVVVGASLLIAAGVRARTTAIEMAACSPQAGRPAESAQVADALFRCAGDSAHRVGLLVIAEGSASRGPDSPGGGHEAAEGFDLRLTSALATGDPAALAAANTVHAALARALIFTSGPAFSAMAELTRRRPPQRSEVLFQGAPFGVGYVVATWSWY